MIPTILILTAFGIVTILYFLAWLFPKEVSDNA